ncbi:MFS transporter [Spirosoma fluviale]|uniref:MFS transporter, ACS family, D-galactonate transporter n=1 Tax=Spirosoma fluviale TaxID=1597977 RepID=A0A286GBN9_9BACT|nr:MFS transporter [Spirosoma fluviale]SOD92912.1 MFS transporter, ACS family, D-galactonate transporter [Spirosoma fluviale]
MEQVIGKDKKTRVRYSMLALVFINVVINYLDRSNISVAGTALSKDMDLSSEQLGFIFSAFGWTYALLQIPGGLIADRFGPRILYAFCLITWSLATVCQGFVRGFASLFSLRLATGAFEAPSYPINNRIVTSWFPEHERASSIALYVSGQFIGLAFLTPVLTYIQSQFGWQGLFICTGIVGLIWGVVWYLLYRDPLDHPTVNEAELTYIEEGGGLFRGRQAGTSKSSVWSWVNVKQVFSTRTLWGVYIGQFAVNSMLWFFLTWFPTYLVKYRGLDFIKSGYLASVPFLAACAGLLLSGFVSDRLVKQGKSVTMARKAPIIIGLLLSISIVGANYTNDTALIIAFMALAFFGSGMALISWVFVSILSPKHLIGLTGGVFNFMGNLASIVVPIVIGYLAKDGDFKPALVFVGALGLIGACSYIFLVGKIERVVTHDPQEGVFAGE